MKRLIFFLLALLLLSACAGNPSETAATPASEIPGFFTTGQKLDGGDEVQELNLRSVDAAVNGTETLVSLSFVTGSAKAGGEEKPLNDTPAYEVEILEGPGRVLVTLPLHFRDYRGKEPEPAGVFTGITTLPGNADEGGTRIYFHFTGKVGVRVDAQQGALILHVMPENPDLDEAYYVSMDYAKAVQEIALQEGMHPVLCEGGEKRMFLSAPFADNAEADALTVGVNALLDGAGENQRAGVMTMNGNWPPVYHTHLSVQDLENMGALETEDGTLYTAIPWAVDARFLAWMPDGKGLCAHPISQIEGNETVAYEQLWIYDTQGKRTPFLDMDFAAVDAARFSPDGNYLAFIERVEAKRLLYLYDMRTGSLDFLSAEGMGDFTASFAWSADNKLYALSGTYSIQLMRFDPSLADQDESRVSAVEERYGGVGNVGCANGKVYINGDAAGTIYEIDLQTGERAEFADGDDFFTAPGGDLMLISYYETSGENGGYDTQTGVKVRNMDTGEEIELTSGMTYHGGCWSRDGSLLAYLVSNYAQVDVFEDDEDRQADAENTKYPARLYTYDREQGTAVLRGMLASDQVYPGLTGSEVVLVAYHTREDQTVVPVTYRLQLP